MTKQHPYTVQGRVDGIRLESRLLEEQIQQAVADGHRTLTVNAFGQHGIGGRLWHDDDTPIHITINGPSGQRLGSMGFDGTRIDVIGPASDDVGWLNAGADISIYGNAGNGTCNAMAQGIVRVAGNIGSRGMTMTKENPRFEPPQLWVLGGAGDYFGEFMAGGVAVICGVNAPDPTNVIGYRPLVGMVSGRVFLRGPHDGFSQADARQEAISDADWAWLTDGLKTFLEKMDQTDRYPDLTDRDQWQLLVAKMPHERTTMSRRSMAQFHQEIWEGELGRGGLIGDLTNLDRSAIPVITTGEMRRYVPVWENRKYAPPCEGTCPTGIPVHDRWRLIREGRVDEAVDMALGYTPFPATVCGYLCPNPCMGACTKHSAFLTPVDVTQLGKASIKAVLPELPPLSGKRVAVIGGGPAGISTAWQLRQHGHEAVVYDMAETLGGKIASVIPDSRIPADVVETEIDRVRKVIPHVHLQQRLSQDEVAGLQTDYDFLVVAAGAQKPRTLPVPGNKRMITANDFLAEAKAGTATVGKNVVIIGAGNVGCDAATEAHRMGAESLLLIDVQEPASFGKERDEAEAAGAQFRWPCFTQEITPEGIKLTSGEVIPADTVIISIGDQPDLDFLPESVATDRGFIRVDENGQTSDPTIFAIGDAVKIGLITDAIGSGRQAAAAIDDIIAGRRPSRNPREIIDTRRISMEYFDPRITEYADLETCGAECSSCGACRDCGICIAICPRTAISRADTDGGGYEYVVDAERCIGCGFCGGACPCGVWDLVENTPVG